MAHVTETVVNLKLRDKSVLDVGAMNINGSPRGLFTGPYLGIDMRYGPGVDKVLDAHDLSRVYQSVWDVVLWLEAAEHDSAPWRSCVEMRKAARHDAWLIASARGYDERGCFPVHSYPDDLWRFSCMGFNIMLRQTGWLPQSVVADPEAPGVLAIAKAGLLL